MKYIYNPTGVCSRQMIFEIDNDIIKSLQVIGGCPGNLQGISKLLVNRNVDEVINLLSDVKCAKRDTSCPAQIAEALKLIKSKQLLPSN